MKLLSRVRLFVTPWTVAHQAPPSMEFSRQEYWCGFPFPSPMLRFMGSKRVGHDWVTELNWTITLELEHEIYFSLKIGQKFLLSKYLHVFTIKFSFRMCLDLTRKIWTFSINSNHKIIMQEWIFVKNGSLWALKWGWPDFWASILIFLSLSFRICKMGATLPISSILNII